MRAEDEIRLPGSTFLLFPRKENEPILPSLKRGKTTERHKEKQWEDFLHKFRPVSPRFDLYRRSKEEVEEGKTLIDFYEVENEKKEALAIPEEMMPAPVVPKPKPPELEIPAWEGKVSIAGRKFIGLTMETKKYLNPPHPLRPRITPKPTFDLRQELQLRVQGNVSERVTVNVDYDDTKDNKRDISIVYKGKPGETVREISFGDIQLSLPQTQFTSYSKQLFGIKGDFDFKKARLMVVGSQTKGQFAVRRFKGEFQFESKDITDTAYLRRTYYNVSFDNSHLPFVTGSMSVYRDDRNANNNANTIPLSVEDFVEAAATYDGNFDILTPGVDYIVDYLTGILRFTSAQPANAVIAVDYIQANGPKLSASGTGKPKIIKTDGDLAIANNATEVGNKKEMYTIYTIGRRKITRDDGTGNFILKVLEAGSRKDVSDTLGIRYPDNIEVDFENGYFELDNQISDSEIYPPNAKHKYIFNLEYRFVQKTYTLHPGIVLQSEKVYQSGRLLSRDVDYFIDYDIGIITFLKPEAITPATEIEITYEFAPFGARLTETLLGARGETDLFSNLSFLGFNIGKLSLGSSFLMQQSAKPQTIPDVRSLPTNYSILEGDLHLTGLKIPGPIPLTTNAHAEIARSIRNPNTFRKALIESMESVKIEDSIAIHQNFWQNAANPPIAGLNITQDVGAIGLSVESTKTNEIFPASDAPDKDMQDVLRISYDLTNSTMASASYIFSTIGLDFSGRDFLEATVWSEGDADAPEVTIHLGKINEDADGDGFLDTEDANIDGTLNFGEDVGYAFNNPDGTSQNVNSGNGMLDTEDLDRNGRLDAEDPDIGGFYGLEPGATSTVADFSGWITTSVPLGITTSNMNKWTSIKTLRITLRRRSMAKTTGVIKIARMSVSGMRWERPALLNSTGTFSVNAINNIDHPGLYQALFDAGGEVADMYDDLYGSEDSPTGIETIGKRREQSLQLILDNFGPSGANSASGYTRLPFTKPIDIQNHKILSFFFHGPRSPLSAGTSFYFRMGSANDYYEYQIPLDTANMNKWYYLRLALLDRNKDGVVDKVAPDNHPELSPFIVVNGNPNLASISEFRLGVAASTQSVPSSGEIWVNDIFLIEPRDKEGTAKYLSMDFDLPRWMSFGFDYKSYGQDFEGLGQSIINQALAHRGAFVNFKRLSFLPFSARGSRDEITTPSAIKTGPSNLVSQLAEGKVEKQEGSASGSLIIPLVPIIKLPTFNWSTSGNKTENKDLKRVDVNESHGASYSWSKPLGFSFIRSWNVGVGRSNYRLTFPQELRLAGSDNLKSMSKSWDTGMSIGLLKDRITLGPTYNISTNFETRKLLNQDMTTDEENYQKSADQSAGLTMNLRVLNWLEPSATFKSTIKENYRVESATFTLPAFSSATFKRGDIKSINRQASLSLSQNMDFARIFPKFSLFKSFNHSLNYQITDGDTYENVDKDFESLKYLWIRQDLVLPNAEARRTNLTMRDAFTANSRWSPFVGIFPRSPWSTLAITHTFSKTADRSETTGTGSRSISLNFPDVVASLSRLESIVRATKWMSSSQLNTRFSIRRKLMVRIERSKNTSLGGDLHFLVKRFYDLTLNYSQTKEIANNLLTHTIKSRSLTRQGGAQVGFNWNIWRLTGRTDVSKSIAYDALNRLTTHSKVIHPTLSIRGDFSTPSGLKLPLIKKTLKFTNRYILSSNLSLERKRSKLSITSSNTDTWKWDLKGDFEVGKNLRAGLGTGLTLFKNIVIKDQNYYIFNLNAQIIFQF
ncbi:hypothetical protein ACFL6Y_00590 [Elusimicrobiota bacterium]